MLGLIGSIDKHDKKIGADELHTNQTPAFNVRRNEPELVRPSQPTPNKLKLLSHVDQQDVVRGTMPVIMLFPPNPAMRGRNPGKVIKNALADALVYYYPWAGRVRGDRHSQKLAVDCNAEGVVFGEADADVSLRELPLLPPFPFFDKLLYTDTMELFDCPLLTMQVTRLSCGGFILAFRLNHLISDGEGLCQFLYALTEFAHGASAPSIIPVWQRHLLNSCDPNHVTHTNHDINSPPIENPDDNLVHRQFQFGAQDVATLRGRIEPRLQPCTNFELIASALWHCRTVGLEYKTEEEVHLTIDFNARRKFNPPLPNGYYGNAVTMAAAVSPASKIYYDNTLNYTVELVKKAKDTVMEEYKRSLIGPSILRGNHLSFNVRSYNISDVTHLGLPSMDFGWGTPLYSGTVTSGYIANASHIAPFRNEKGENVKTASVYLPKDAMDRFGKALDSLLKSGVAMGRVGSGLGLVSRV